MVRKQKQNGESYDNYFLSYHSSCRKDQFTALILKFDIAILRIQVY